MSLPAPRDRLIVRSLCTRRGALAMNKFTTVLIGSALLALGCTHDRPHEYGEQRPPVGELDKRVRELQSKELENDGAYGGAPGPKGIQPDYSLYAKVMELPNRGTSYYLMEFTLTDLHTRELAWTNSYEVKVER